MFQLIASLLGFFAILSALAGSLIAGTVFALLTFIWVVVAKPARRAQPSSAPWGAVYEMPITR